MKGIGENDKLLVCGYMKGHVGAKANGFEGMHGGKRVQKQKYRGRDAVRISRCYGTGCM